MAAHAEGGSHSLRQVRLTANPKKCVIGGGRYDIWRYHMGQGQVQSQLNNSSYCDLPEALV